MIHALYSARERDFPSDSVNALVLTRVRGTYVFLTPLIVSVVDVGIRGVVVGVVIGLIFDVHRCAFIKGTALLHVVLFQNASVYDELLHVTVIVQSGLNCAEDVSK